jgi:predicted MFS family arabinose efflux permease
MSTMSMNALTRRPVLPAMPAFVLTAASMTAFFLAAGAPTPLLILKEQEWGFAPWLLTLALGIYAISLLAVLVTAGRLSDYVGRRPVLLAALVVETVAMIMLMSAGNIETIVAGRFVQGLATGAATSAFSSAVIELAPQRARGVAAPLVSAAPAAGLGLGALAAGVLASTVADANEIVWVALAVISALGALAVLALPETGTPRPGARASLRPSMTVPASSRRAFRTAAPTLVAAWMMAALFMDLVPATLGADFGITSTLTDGATAFLLPASAAVATIVTTRLAPGLMLRIAGAATVAGALLFLTGLTTQHMWLLDAAGVVGGVGFGTAFGAMIRSTVRDASPDRRAGLFAAIYAVSYLAFGVPAILSGILITAVGLTPVVTGLVTVIAAIAVAGMTLSALHGRTTRSNRRRANRSGTNATSAAPCAV